MLRTTLAMLLGSAVLIGATMPAAADCIYNGHSYSEGTKIGDRTCRNGSWVGG